MSISTYVVDERGVRGGGGLHMLAEVLPEPLNRRRLLHARRVDPQLPTVLVRRNVGLD